jgi:hypothetical protein
MGHIFIEDHEKEKDKIRKSKGKCPKIIRREAIWFDLK